MRSILAFVLVSLTATLAFGAAGPKQQYAKYGRVINVQLDSASESFVVSSDNPDTNGIWGLITAWVCVTDANNSVTAINMTCTGSHNGGTTDYTLQDCSSVVAGVCTSVDVSWTKNPSAISSPKCWPWRIDVEGIPEVECTFTDTGGDASDNIAVYLSLSTKGS